MSFVCCRGWNISTWQEKSKQISIALKMTKNQAFEPWIGLQGCYPKNGGGLGDLVSGWFLCPRHGLQVVVVVVDVGGGVAVTKWDLSNVFWVSTPPTSHKEKYLQESRKSLFIFLLLSKMWHHWDCMLLWQIFRLQSIFQAAI